MNLCYYNLEIFHIITSQNIISAVLNPSSQRALPDGGNSVPSFSAGLQFAGRAHPFRFNARERRRPVRASRRALARLPAAFPCIDCGALSTCADAVSKREFTLQTSRTRRAMEAEPNGYYQAGCHGTAVGCDVVIVCFVVIHSVLTMDGPCRLWRNVAASTAGFNFSQLNPQRRWLRPLEN